MQEAHVGLLSPSRPKTRVRTAAPTPPTSPSLSNFLIVRLGLQPLPPPSFSNKDNGVCRTMAVALAFHLAGEGKWDTDSGNLLLPMGAAWLDSFQGLLIKINCPGRFCQRKHPKLQAHGRLKIDMLRAASETLIFAFLTPELWG